MKFPSRKQLLKDGRVTRSIRLPKEVWAQIDKHGDDCYLCSNTVVQMIIRQFFNKPYEKF